MALTEEQIKQIKEQLLEQLKNFPEEKREQIKKQITSMSNEDVENFVKQNQLNHLPGGCIFCGIVQNKTPSFKIEENEENIAILEINPLSKGHSLIVPKNHDGEIGNSSKKLAEEIKKKLEETYSPKEIQIEETKIMEHPLLEIIPIYGDEKERTKESEEVLKKIQTDLTSTPEKPPKEEIKLETKKVEIPKLKPRIP